MNQSFCLTRHYIKEAKNGFFMDKVNHHDLIANKNMMQIQVLSYNLVRLFSLNILPFQFRQHQIEKLRNKILKTGVRRVKSARQFKFHFASRYLYKHEFFEILKADRKSTRLNSSD